MEFPSGTPAVTFTDVLSGGMEATHTITITCPVGGIEINENLNFTGLITFSHSFIHKNDVVKISAHLVMFYCCPKTPEILLYKLHCKNHKKN